MSAPLVPVSIELTLGCPSCRAPVALNAIVPRATCDRCKRTTHISAAVWASMLSDPLREATEMQDGEQRDMAFDGEIGLVRRVFRRAPPTCQVCQHEVSPQQLFAAADTGWLTCAGCQKPLTVRKLGDVTPGAELILGEDQDMLYERPMNAPEARAIPCPQCSAPLQASPASRELRCPYCRSHSYVPDDVWARLHPTRPVTRFYGFVRAKARGSAASDFELSSLSDAVVDGGGNLYVALDDDGVAALNADLSPRWIRRDVKRNRVALVGGRVVAYKDEGEGCRKAKALDPRDGKDAAPFQLPPETQLFQGDFEGNALALVGDLESEDRKIIRLDPSGRQLPLFTAGSPGLLSRLAGATHEHLAIGLGGGGTFGALPGAGVAVLRVKMGDEFYVVLGVHDASGREVSSARVPIDFVDIYAGKRIHFDALGRLLFINDESVLWIGAHGARPLVKLREDVRAIAPLPNGELWVFGYDSARRFDRDGREIYSDQRARKADRNDDD